MTQFPMIGGRHNRIVEMLSRDRVAFGWIANAVDVATGLRIARDRQMDFVFLSMDTPAAYQPPAVKSLIKGMLEAGLNTNPNDHPLMVRLATAREDPAAAPRRTSEILNLGAHAIVFSAVESAAEATQAIASMRLPRTAANSKAPAPAGVRAAALGDAPGYWGMGDDEYELRADLWPLNSFGELVSVFAIESEPGLANCRDILRVKPTIVLPGQAGLTRLYGGDTSRIEQAVQTVLAASSELKLPCAIVATASTVERRLKEGFRVVLFEDRDYVEGVRVGRKIAGR